jgi:glycosyltransferase involved in cell wall biosynthesis
MSPRPLRILQIFNRYQQYGGEEAVVAQIGKALSGSNDVEDFFYSTAELSGPDVWSKVNAPLKAFHNADVLARLEQLHSGRPHDIWQIHNIFPAMSPVVYEKAFEWNIPIVHYLHNYRLSCVNGFFLNHGASCQRCLSGNFWPAFATACWRDSHLQSGWMGLITNRIRRMGLFDRVFRWIAISEAQKREHVRMGIPAERIRVIHHFLEAEQGPLPPSGNQMVLFVGRLSVEKGVDRLLDAWKKVAGGERRLVIIGDGPERPALEAKAANLTGVLFTGFLPGDEQEAYWRQALFSVVPSIWLEPFGMTVLEAWSHGRPLVAHAIGALPELINDGVDGLLASPESADDLAAKLETLLSDPARTQAMGQAGRRRLETDFSKARWLRQVEEVYAELPQNSAQRDALEGRHLQ